MRGIIVLTRQSIYDKDWEKFGILWYFYISTLGVEIMKLGCKFPSLVQESIPTTTNGF